MSCSNELKKLDVSMAERARILKDESFLQDKLDKARERLDLITSNAKEDISFDNPDKFLDYVESLIPDNHKELMADVFSKVRESKLYIGKSFPQQLANVIAGIYTHRTKETIDWSGRTTRDAGAKGARQGVQKGMELPGASKKDGSTKGLAGGDGLSVKGKPSTQGKLEVPLSKEELLRQAEDRADVALNSTGKLTPVLSKFKEVRNLASEAFRSTRSRIAEYSTKVAEMLQRYENGVHQDMKKYKVAIESYAESYSKLTEKQKMMWADAVYSGNVELKNALVKEFNIDITSFDAMQEELRDRAVSVGLVDHLVDGYYHHRKIKDYEGLMLHLHEENPDIANMIDVEIERRSKKFAREGKGFSKNDRYQVIGDMLNAGYGNVIKKPAGSKERMIRTIPPSALKFYADPISSAIEGTYDMTDAVNIRETFGVTSRKKELVKLRSLSRRIDKLRNEETRLAKGKDNEKRLGQIASEKLMLRSEFNDMGNKLEESEGILETSIAAVISETVDKKDQQQVIDLLRGRIKQRGAYGVVSAARNIMLATTLGNPLSAITQLGDFAFIIYDTGVLNTMSATARAIASTVQKGQLTRKYFDFGHSISDFTSSSSTAKMLDKVLTYSGLKSIDLFGKEVHLQASLKKWGDVAKSGDNKRFFAKWERYLGEDTQATFDDLRDGKETERVVFMLFNALSDKQPISLSELPQAYLKGGNLRVFYMLKTFSIKALNVMYDEAALEIKRGNYAKAGLKVTYLVTLLAACGAGADEIKELLLTMTGSKIDTKDRSFDGMMKALDDNTVDNMFQLFLLNRYSMAKGIKQDRFISNVIDGVLPPVRFADHFIADIFGIINGEGYKAKSIQDIPLIGKFITGRFDVNKEMKLDMSRKDIYTRVASEGISAVSEEVSAHNRAARKAGFPDMVIKGKDLRSKYKASLVKDSDALKKRRKLMSKREAFRDAYDETEWED